MRVVNADPGTYGFQSSFYSNEIKSILSGEEIINSTKFHFFTQSFKLYARMFVTFESSGTQKVNSSEVKLSSSS